MGKFIIGTFAILAWAFYVMSGGATYVPETQIAAADVPPPDVTRAAVPEFAAVTRPADAPIPAVLPATAIAPTPPPAPTAIPVSSTQVSPSAPVFDGTQAEAIGISPIFTSLSAPAPASVGSPDLTTLREVAARAVNMRAGPDTSYSVIDTLPQGTQTEVLESDGAGWVRVRVVGTGQMGWMAERLLTNG